MLKKTETIYPFILPIHLLSVLSLIIKLDNTKFSFAVIIHLAFSFAVIIFTYILSTLNSKIKHYLYTCHRGRLDPQNIDNKNLAQANSQCRLPDRYNSCWYKRLSWYHMLVIPWNLAKTINKYMQIRKHLRKLVNDM